MQALAWIAMPLDGGQPGCLLYPITLYFVITASTGAPEILRIYLKRVRGVQPTGGIVPPFFFSLLRRDHSGSRLSASARESRALVDRSLEKNSCKVRSKGQRKYPVRLASGSFEVLRALGVMQRGFPLKVLMDTAHNQNHTRFFDAA